MSRQEQITALVVDDSRLARGIVERCLEEMEDIRLLPSIANAANAELACLRGEIDLILMDVCTADGESGLAAAARIKRQHPQIRIIIMTSMPEVSFLSKAREAGAESFWYKEGETELAEVVRRTLAGESVYPEQTPVIRLGQTDSTELTARELELIREFVEGKTYEEIAADLGIRVNTVKYHVKNLLSKTGFRNSMQLAVEAVDKKLVLPRF